MVESDLEYVQTYIVCLRWTICDIVILTGLARPPVIPVLWLWYSRQCMFITHGHGEIDIIFSHGVPFFVPSARSTRLIKIYIKLGKIMRRATRGWDKSTLQIAKGNRSR